MSRFSKWLRRKKNGGGNTEERADATVPNLDEQGSPIGDFSSEERLTPEEEEALIEKIAKKIVSSGFNFPAMVFLNSSKPFTHLGRELFYFVEPFINPFLDIDKFGKKYQIFKEEENIERLIKKIEELS